MVGAFTFYETLVGDKKWVFKLIITACYFLGETRLLAVVDLQTIQVRS